MRAGTHCQAQLSAMCFQSEATTYIQPALQGPGHLHLQDAGLPQQCSATRIRLYPHVRGGQGLALITLAAQNLPLYNRVQCVTSHGQGPSGSVPSRLILPATHTVHGLTRGRLVPWAASLRKTLSLELRPQRRWPRTRGPGGGLSGSLNSGSRPQDGGMAGSFGSTSTLLHSGTSNELNGVLGVPGVLISQLLAGLEVPGLAG